MNQNKVSILHLDDDKQILIKTKHSLKQFIFDYEINYNQAENIESFKEKLQALKPQCIILDISLDKDQSAGIRLLKEVRESHPEIVIVMLSSGTDPETIKTALLSGASDYASKGLEPAELAYRINQAIKNSQMLKLIDAANQRQFAGDIMRAIHLKMPRILRSPVRSVLVTGESGTGKEKIFEMIQAELPATTPFIAINCASIAKDLIESELFGHVKGAFTGALTTKAGLFEKANGGWIFLDEVAQLSSKAQSALLRTLESGDIRPVGSQTTKKTNVRVLAATNEDLDAMAAQGSFRQDLIQRLRSYQIELPALRERSQEELSEIIDFLTYRLNKQAKELAYTQDREFRLATEAKILLMNNDWSDGNIREIWQTLLAASVEAIPVKGSQVITASSLPKSLLSKVTRLPDANAKSALNQDETETNSVSFPIDLKQQEDRFMLEILNQLADSHPECLRFKSKIVDKLGAGRHYVESKMDRLYHSGMLPSAYLHFYK